MRCFRVDDRGLQVGHIIEQGRWGRLLGEIGDAHEQFEREMMLERIRVSEFPEKPSRLTGSFAFGYLKHADQFQEWRWNNGLKEHVYEVVPVDPQAAIHQAYLLCIPPLRDIDPISVCRAYWSSESLALGIDFARESAFEIIIDCPLQIIRVCHEPFTDGYQALMEREFY